MATHLYSQCTARTEGISRSNWFARLAESVSSGFKSKTLCQYIKWQSIRVTLLPPQASTHMGTHVYTQACMHTYVKEKAKYFNRAKDVVQRMYLPRPRFKPENYMKEPIYYTHMLSLVKAQRNLVLIHLEFRLLIIIFTCVIFKSPTDLYDL